MGYEQFCESFVNSHVYRLYAPVICISGPPKTGGSRDKAGLKCRDLTSDESWQCQRFNSFKCQRLPGACVYVQILL